MSASENKRSRAGQCVRVAKWQAPKSSLYLFFQTTFIQKQGHVMVCTTHTYLQRAFHFSFLFCESTPYMCMHACIPLPPFSGLLLNPDSQTSVYTIGAWGCWQEKRGEGLLAAVRHSADSTDPLRGDPQSAQRNSRRRGKAEVNSLQRADSRLGRWEATSF